jgi:oxygen-independent coproporphyrinogen III oxidase
MNDGVDLAVLKTRWKTAPWRQVEALLGRLADEGLALREGERVKLTLRGRLVADAIGSEIMGAFSEEAA